MLDPHRPSPREDERSLSSYGLKQQDSVLLVPTLRDEPRRPTFAPRGLLALPQSKAWTPRGPAAFLPVLCSDVSRHFPIAMEFKAPQDAEAFAQAAQHAPPWLEILRPDLTWGVNKLLGHIDGNRIS